MPLSLRSSASQGNSPNPASQRISPLSGSCHSSPPCASPRRRKAVFPRKESHPTESRKMPCRRMDSRQMEPPSVRLLVRLPMACRCRMPAPALLPRPPFRQTRAHHPTPQRLHLRECLSRPWESDGGLWSDSQRATAQRRSILTSADRSVDCCRSFIPCMSRPPHSAGRIPRCIFVEMEYHRSVAAGDSSTTARFLISHAGWS